MSGVMNKTARQFNLKTISKDKSRICVRVAPGFNVIDSTIWESFVSKDGKNVDPYVAELKKTGCLEFGSATDDKELDMDSSTKVKVKITPEPKAMSK